MVEICGGGGDFRFFRFQGGWVLRRECPELTYRPLEGILAELLCADIATGLML